MFFCFRLILFILFVLGKPTGLGAEVYVCDGPYESLEFLYSADIEKISAFHGAEVSFNHEASAQSAYISAETGSKIEFYNNDENRASIALSSESVLSCSGDATLGSISGDDSTRIVLHNAQIKVGSNDTSTTFAGTLLNSGCFSSLSKIGTGVWTLTGDNRDFIDPIALYEGKLVLQGTLGSSLSILGGVFSGCGTVYGDLVIVGGRIELSGQCVTVENGLMVGSEAVIHVKISDEFAGMTIMDTVCLNGILELDGDLPEEGVILMRIKKIQGKFSEVRSTCNCEVVYGDSAVTVRSPTL